MTFTDDELDLVLAAVFGSCWDAIDDEARAGYRDDARRGFAKMTEAAGGPGSPDLPRVTDDELDVVLGEVFAAGWDRAREDARSDRRWELRVGLARVGDLRRARAAA